MGDKLRIHVGGLGSHVKASDLEKTFTSPQLGAVQSVEIIRTKGRSFAYLEFVPVSDKGLAKLFNTYNGCMWKGGRLKLEKAKEQYLSRLRREWAEDDLLEAKLSSQNVDADESVHALLKPKKDQDIDKLQLNIFFPRLRKIKPIPLKGSGKHKYSFQRIEVPPLPTHFCDCEEHSRPLEPTKLNHSGLPQPAKRNNNDDYEVDKDGVNEEELSMMKSVLDKLLAKDAKPTEEIQHDASLVDKWQVDDIEEEDQDSDEDNLVINIVGKSSKGVSSFEDWGQKTSIANQDSLVSELKSLSNTTPKMQGTKGGNHIMDKKRKQSVCEDKSNDTLPSKKKGKKGVCHDSTDDQVVINTKPANKESSTVRFSDNVASSNKSAWKALVSKNGSTAFKISDILTSHNADFETESGTNPVTEPCSNENDVQQNQTTKQEEMETESGSNPVTEPSPNENDVQQNQTTKQEDFEKVSDVQSTNPTASEARGVSWKQNSDFETGPGSDLAMEPCSNENDVQQDKTTKHEELEKVSDVQSTMPPASEARGAFWKHKSSWLQLVGDANTSAFSLSQVLPGVTFQNQESQHFKVIDYSNSRSGKQPKFGHKDEKSYVEANGEPKGPANEDIYATPKILNENVLSTERNNGAPNEKVGVKESSALLPGPNLMPNYGALGEIVISETCPFMRTATSRKEWSKSKASLSGSHKKKVKAKESDQD